MWLIFISKFNKNNIIYIDIKKCYSIMFNNTEDVTTVIFSSNEKEVYLDSDKWQIDTSYCNDVKVDSSDEERFLTEMLSRLTTVFKEVEID